MKCIRILIVGQSSEQPILREILCAAGFEVFARQTIVESLPVLNGIDVVIADAAVESTKGLFEQCWNMEAPPGLIAITDPWTISSALQNLRGVPVTFLKRPFLRDELLCTVREAIRYVELFRNYARLRQSVDVHGAQDSGHDCV